MQRDVVLPIWNCLLNPKENKNNNFVLVPIAVEYDSWVFFFFFLGIFAPYFYYDERKVVINNLNIASG